MKHGVVRSTGGGEGEEADAPTGGGGGVTSEREGEASKRQACRMHAGCRMRARRRGEEKKRAKGRYPPPLKL